VVLATPTTIIVLRMDSWISLFRVKPASEEQSIKKEAPETTCPCEPVTTKLFFREIKACFTM
jgi:hypothetical protein